MRQGHRNWLHQASKEMHKRRPALRVLRRIPKFKRNDVSRRLKWVLWFVPLPNLIAAIPTPPAAANTSSHSLKVHTRAMSRGYQQDRTGAAYQPLISHAPQVARSSSDTSRRALQDKCLGECERRSNDRTHLHPGQTSKHPVSRLVGAPKWRDRDGAGKLSTWYERARRLRLVLSLGLQNLFF